MSTIRSAARSLPDGAAAVERVLRAACLPEEGELDEAVAAAVAKELGRELGTQAATVAQLCRLSDEVQFEGEGAAVPAQQPRLPRLADALGVGPRYMKSERHRHLYVLGQCHAFAMATLEAAAEGAVSSPPGALPLGALAAPDTPTTTDSDSARSSESSNGCLPAAGAQSPSP